MASCPLDPPREIPFGMVSSHRTRPGNSVGHSVTNHVPKIWSQGPLGGSQKTPSATDALPWGIWARFSTENLPPRTDHLGRFLADLRQNRGVTGVIGRQPNKG
eukprot:3038643-Pyramimonas_sp.AAC.1